MRLKCTESENGSHRRPISTVVIATKNRLSDLRVAVASALTQSVPVEVLVMDDGSTDGTAQAIEREFPTVTVHRTEDSTGYIVKRNLGAELATTPFVFSIDDDAAFNSPRTVEQTLANFDNDNIVAVAIPHVNIKYSPKVINSPPDTRQTYVTDTFIGTSYAVRRDWFVKVGGFCAAYFHQVEEQEFCARLIGSHQLIRLGTADPIYHFESPIRDLTRVRIYNARNNILHTWQHVPRRWLAIHWIGNIANLLLDGAKNGHLRISATGIYYGYRAVLAGEVQRRPLTIEAYRLLRILRRSPMTLDDALSVLGKPLTTDRFAT